MLALAGVAPPILDANPIAAPIEWIVGSIGSYLQTLHLEKVVGEPLALLVPLQDPSTAVAQNPLARIVPSGGGFQRIASSVQALGYVLLAIVLVVHMLKHAATGRLRSPEHVLFELAPKLVLGLLAMQYFDQALNDAGQVSMESAFLLEDAMLLPLHLDVDNILGVFPTDGLGVVLMPMLYLLVVYLVLLVITSRLVLLLGALISPLGIPIAIQSDHGRLAGTWIRMLVSGLLVPVLAGIGAAGSLAVGWLVHQIAGNGPFLGSYLGALTAECGLFFTAVATTAMFKDAFKQGVAGVRGSIQGVGMGAVAAAPGEALARARRGAEAAAGVAMGAAGVPVGAALATKALAGRKPGPDPDAGSDGATPGVPRLPGGSGGNGGGSQMSLPSATVRRLPAGPPDTAAPSQLMLPAPPGADVRALTEEFSARRRVDGGEVTYEFERRYRLHYATHLSEPAGDVLVDPGLGRAEES